MTKAWLCLCAFILWTGCWWVAGYHYRDIVADSDAKGVKLAEVSDANLEWARRFTLEAQLATRDQQLAEAQQAAKTTRTETVIKREVIYRDKIKNVVVRDCVADSGLLDLYDATIGLSSPAE